MKAETDTIPVEKKGQLEIEEKSATLRDLSRGIIKNRYGQRIRLSTYPKT